MRVKEEGPETPVEPPRQDEGPAGGPTEEELEARRRKGWERRAERARAFVQQWPKHFEFRVGEYPDPGILIGHNPMAPEYDHLREADVADD